MKTIMLTSQNKEDSIKSVNYLVEDIKAREDANHKLYFRFLMAGAYMVSMGCEDTDGVKHFVGEHEIIFMPSNRTQDIERLKELKDIVWLKNCMIIAGDGDKPKKLRNSLIDWLLEKKEDFESEED